MVTLAAPHYLSTGLKPALMFQFGFQSNLNQYEAGKVSFATSGDPTKYSYWWDDNAGGSRYSWANGEDRYRTEYGSSGYIKQAPLEADWQRCALFSKRDPVTWSLDPVNGVNIFQASGSMPTVFRGDRNGEHRWRDQWYADMAAHWKSVNLWDDLTPMRGNTPIVEA